MTQVVPGSRTAMARAAFIRALAKRTDAIRELRAWRRPPSAPGCVGELRRTLDLIHLDGPDGLHDVTATSWLGSAQAAVFALAGAEHAGAAEAWARRWTLGDAAWLRERHADGHRPPQSAEVHRDGLPGVASGVTRRLLAAHGLEQFLNRMRYNAPAPTQRGQAGTAGERKDVTAERKYPVSQLR